VSAIDAVAERVALLPAPWRVAVDGVTAAGKSTVADALAERLGAERLSIDDFHRAAQAEYYPSSFDFDRFRTAVLRVEVSLVADGVFLHHPDVRDLWDLTVCLRVDREVARERGIARDRSWMANARERYASRYFPGETRYLEEVAPYRQADILLDTTRLDAIRLVRVGLCEVSKARKS
jgi:uridine kinase